jgi:hypothetical protein
MKLTYNEDTRTFSVKEPELGQCYQVAYHYFDKNYPRNHNLRLVHGLVTGQGPIKGIIYNHAWVEDVQKKIVIDETFPEPYRVMPVDLYYRLGKVVSTYKYDLMQVMMKASTFKTYGPWEDELIKNKY